MSPLPRPLGTLLFLAAWLTPWRPAYRVRAAQSGLAFYLHHRDAIGRHIAKYGTHEPLVTRWISDYLAAARPGVVVDIGANVGWHALHAAQHAAAEVVVAFEPDPFNAWLLDRNLVANGIDKVIVDSRAAGAKPGAGRLHRYKSSNFGRHSLVADHGFGSRAVAIVDLDRALDTLGLGERPVALIKIDVEGYEPAVIAGAARTLGRTGAIVLEYSPGLGQAGGLSADDMVAQLRALGFAPFALSGDGGTVPVGDDELRGFQGSLDLIWLRADRLSPNAKSAMNERPRGAITLQQIAERNKHMVTPI